MPSKKAPAPESPAPPKSRRDRTIVGSSAAIQSVLAEARRFALVDWPVLILGENGTGKELFAHLIHSESRRAAGPFVAVNVGTWEPEAADSELFGVVKGAFTGVEPRPGLMRRADGGTLFLDEIGAMRLGVQAKLLRALQEKEVRPMGSSGEPIPVNFRIITATNVDLSEARRSGEFREDLYHRISRCVLRVPSLRDRLEDVPALARHILDGEEPTKGKELSNSALAILMKHSWPGNVRELENVVLSAGLAARDLVEREHVERVLHESSAPVLARFPSGAVREGVVGYMSKLSRPVTSAELARALGMAKSTLMGHLKKLEDEGTVEKQGEHKSTVYVLLPPMTGAELEEGRTKRAQRRWQEIQRENLATRYGDTPEARARGERAWWDTKKG
jgi:transcriptional regulator with PAS, ATPase and Fis domain